jgi:hypothetical protein
LLFSLWVLSFLLAMRVKQLTGFVDSVLKGLILTKILFYLINWKLNQHTRDLWSLVLATESVNVVIDGMANLLFIEWILILN